MLRSLCTLYISVEIRSLIRLRTELHRSRPRKISFFYRSPLTVTMSSSQSEIISTIDLARVPVDAEIDIHKHDLKLVSSYNWLSNQTPIILVPGNYSNPLILSSRTNAVLRITATMVSTQRSSEAYAGFWSCVHRPKCVPQPILPSRAAHPRRNYFQVRFRFFKHRHSHRPQQPSQTTPRSQLSLIHI